MTNLTKLQQTHERLVQRAKQGGGESGVQVLRARVRQALQDRMRAELDAKKAEQKS